MNNSILRLLLGRRAFPSWKPNGEYDAANESDGPNDDKRPGSCPSLVWSNSSGWKRRWRRSLTWRELQSLDLRRLDPFRLVTADARRRDYVAPKRPLLKLSAADWADDRFVLVNVPRHARTTQLRKNTIG